MSETLRRIYRIMRVSIRKMIGSEPNVKIDHRCNLEFHGNDYCGWSLPRRFLDENSVIVDVGVGEDISFSQSISKQYGCLVHGFDPTPRAAQYISELKPDKFTLHDFGLSDSNQSAEFFLPSNENHVSGSVLAASHLEGDRITVNLVDVERMMDLIGAEQLDVLKIDIEGAEYKVIQSSSFAKMAPRINAVCVEFHHRWKEIGPQETLDAVKTLNDLGFYCAWKADTTNEEFLFVKPETASERAR